MDETTSKLIQQLKRERRFGMFLLNEIAKLVGDLATFLRNRDETCDAVTQIAGNQIRISACSDEDLLLAYEVSKKLGIGCSHVEILRTELLIRDLDEPQNSY